VSAIPPIVPLPDALPVLTGERVRLRALREDDADIAAFFEIFSDPEVMRYWSAVPMTSAEQARARIERSNKYLGEGVGLAWGIAKLADDRVIGSVNFFEFHAQNRSCEVGYVLGREHWGKGLASEALTLGIGYVFEVMQLLRIEADIDPRNAPSERILIRQGFQVEGLLRERWIVGEEISDTRILGLLRREWTGGSSRR
jgi:RimJ/RimL family protein N-acetyltransferase